MKSFHNATQDGPAGTVTDTWLTPQWIIDAIGPFDLDPCGFYSPQHNGPVVKTANHYFTENDDGLKQSWNLFPDKEPQMIFVNYPYSDGKKWMEKVKKEYVPNKVEIIVLNFVRSETVAWQKNVKDATGINLINKRIKFLDSTGIERGNGNAPSALIAFGENAYERIKNVDGILLKLDK